MLIAVSRSEHDLFPGIINVYISFLKMKHCVTTRLLEDDGLKNVPVLVFANKQDLIHALEADEVVGKRGWIDFFGMQRHKKLG